MSGSNVPGIDQNEQAFCVRDSIATTQRAESSSIFLAASIFRIEHALKIQMSSESVTRPQYPQNHKTKQTVGIICGKNSTTTESFPWILKVVHTFNLPFHFCFKIYWCLAD